MEILLSHLTCLFIIFTARTQAYPFKVNHNTQVTHQRTQQIRRLHEALQVQKPWKRFQHGQDTLENEILKLEDTAFPIGCLHMETLEGDYVYTSDGREDVCGMYVIGEPDQLVQIEVLYSNAECQDGGLLSFVDGWELQGEYFPSDEDHVLSQAERFAEFCGGKIPKKFLAHQNAAVVQFQLPKEGQGFSIRVSFIKNKQPCNVISMFPSGVYTLRNYGRKLNCSVAVIYPVNVKILSLDVGQTSKVGGGSIVETGVKSQCDDKDHVQILDGSGLSTTLMHTVLPSICGLGSVPAPDNFTLGCQNSVVRLSSSGRYYNSITVDFAKLEDVEMTECMEK